MALTRRRFPDTCCRSGRRLARVRGDDRPRPARRAVAGALRPDRPRLRRPRRDSRRRSGRDDGRLRARQSRLRLPRARSARAARRPRLHGPPRHGERRGRPRARPRPSTTACTSTPDRCGSRIITTRRWPTAASCRWRRKCSCPIARAPTWPRPARPARGTPDSSSRGPGRFRRLHRGAVEQVAVAGAARSAADRRGSRPGAGVSAPALARSTSSGQYRGSSRRGGDQDRRLHRWRCAICSAGFPTSTCRPTGPLSRR